jgi:hypothetical protein
VGEPKRAVLRVAPDCPPALAAAAAKALAAIAARAVELRCDLPEWSGPKRRKVVWADG